MTYQCEVHGTPRYSACRYCTDANARNATRKHRTAMRRNFEEQSKARQAAFIEKKEAVVVKSTAIPVLREIKRYTHIPDHRPFGPDLISILHKLLADKRAGRLHVDLMRKQLRGGL